MVHPISEYARLPDGRKIYVRRWEAAGPRERGALFIAHGMGETADYYDEFAAAATERGFSVVLPEMRGHGRTAGNIRSPDYRRTGGNPGPDSLHGMAQDMCVFIAGRLRQLPGGPIFLLGHSMGAVVAQLLVGAHGDRLAGLILTGVPSSRAVPALLPVVEREIVRNGSRAVSRDTFDAMFGHANDPFAPVETPLDWITGDREMARQSLAMPYTAVPFTNEFYRDFLLAMRRVDDPAAWDKTPRRLPICLMGGGCDVVGEQGAALRRKQQMLRSLGFADVRCEVFPGLRHSILRETRRREVAESILAWMESHLSAENSSPAGCVPVAEKR